MSELNFESLDLIEIPVNIGGVDYVLREASGDTACKYQNEITRRIELGPEGKPRKLSGVSDTEPLLVHLCLFHKGPDGKEQNVPLATVRSWPNRIVKTLYKRIKEISELDETEEDKDKSGNEQDDTPDGSD